jgi:hypothetical protein
MSDWSLTAWIAYIALALAVVSIGLHIHVAYRDRASVRLRAMLAREMPAFLDQNPALYLTITNVGRRPITITSWGGAFRRPKHAPYFVATTQEMPLVLRESEQHTVISGDWRALHEQSMKELWVYDSSGRRWMLPGAELKALKKQLKGAAQEIANRQQDDSA